jgi:hypothetical protein
MKKINFIAENEHFWNVREKPMPASQLLPDWWKKMNKYSSIEQKFKMSPAPNSTVKQCFPTLDMLNAGYVVTLSADVSIDIGDDGNHEARWMVGYNVFSVWSPHQVSTFEIPDGFSDRVFKNLHGWRIETPAGWSSFISHPFGYQNLPFRSLPGIIDTDLLKGDINVPFVFKKGWTGILEKGTPMFQIIPFERNSWNADYSWQTEEKTKIQSDIFFSKIKKRYGRDFRETRSYK